ncbi:recombination protein RecO [Helicobacter fennelliae]|uniref:DNA replication/recombination mediator RecO N-terminal domain-containing protein n=2 Tax=Helicobacter fennelliae TaxID=215 RepID=T1CPU2_9HELI|nr:recombination protein RecO [Helicobacter fennelliae]GAD18779.1 hypothetical protein HFN_2191 [Helicobacter fennelliae MRY12-0050]SQB97440.1 putative recombination protein RecO [Helicobacter fennelliae]STP07057.1 putative recombination protein RecO [Helicobacter fennelliae]STQ83396.1 putative recombination protein RecO [Helicobacter fennelliae]
MQGYILSTHTQKNEDLIVKILTQDSIENLYRFYGARHSIVHIGHKIDFIKEHNGIFMPRLRNIIHLGFGWERDLERVYAWQRFMELLSAHLKDIYHIEPFYFEILDSGAKKLHKQNPYRVMLEMYAQILHNEGRNPLNNDKCLLCGGALYAQSNTTESSAKLIAESNTQSISLIRGFLPIHTHCSQSTMCFNASQIYTFFTQLSTLHLDDEDIIKLYKILLLGL